MKELRTIIDKEQLEEDREKLNTSRVVDAMETIKQWCKDNNKDCTKCPIYCDIQCYGECTSELLSEWDIKKEGLDV